MGNIDGFYVYGKGSDARLASFAIQNEIYASYLVVGIAKEKKKGETRRCPFDESMLNNVLFHDQS